MDALSCCVLPLPQWQRFRDWQAGLRRNDPATEDQLYAIKRGLQLAKKLLPANLPAADTVNYRAALVEEIDTWRRVNGKSPDDEGIWAMLRRALPVEAVHDVNTFFGETINLSPANLPIANAGMRLLRLLRLLERYGKDLERSLERIWKRHKADQDSDPPQAGAPPVPLPPGTSSPIPRPPKAQPEPLGARLPQQLESSRSRKARGPQGAASETRSQSPVLSAKTHSQSIHSSRPTGVGR